MKRKTSEEKPANRGRHETWCKVCQHPEREAIEHEWLGWGNTTRLAKGYGVSTDSIYRHAHALDLFSKRQRNIRKALERLIEQAESIDVNASAVVSAIQAYAKINANGQWIERVEGVRLNDLFDRMSREELETYAKEGTLPAWFTSVTGAPAADSEGGVERDES
jgi:hypothetical protein